MSKLFNHIFSRLFMYVILFGISAGSGAAQLTLKGEYRPRTELRHGYKTLPSANSDVAFFTEQRSRFQLHYSKDIYEVGFTLQDVRIWGSQDQLNKADGLFSVHEAWGKVELSKKVSLKAGRQELIYDDHRILGNVGWTAQARSHDALLVIASGNSWDLHGGVGFNQDSNPPEPARLFGTFFSDVQNYKTLQYLWYHREFNASEFSFLTLNNGLQVPDSSVAFTQTIGATGQHRIHDFRFKGTVFYQTGKDITKTDVDAWLGALGISYLGFTNASLTLGTDFLSGTGADESTNHSFDPLYGTHHKFYGLMDYFYVGNPHRQPAAAHTYNVGLIDSFVKSTFKPVPEWTISAALHEFRSPVDIIDPDDPSGNVTNRLGTELDLVFGYALSKEVKIQAGYSHLFGTASMEIIKDGSKNQISAWSWIMLSISPVFFSR